MSMFLVILLLVMLVGGTAIAALLRGLAVLALKLAGLAVLVGLVFLVPPEWRNVGLGLVALAGVALWVFVAVTPDPATASHNRASLEYAVKRRRAERSARGEIMPPPGAPITDEEIEQYREEVRQLEFSSKAAARAMKGRTWFLTRTHHPPGSAAGTHEPRMRPSHDPRRKGRPPAAVRHALPAAPGECRATGTEHPMSAGPLCHDRCPLL